MLSIDNPENLLHISSTKNLTMTKEEAIKKFEELLNDFDFKAWAMARAERILEYKENLDEFNEAPGILAAGLMAAIAQEMRWQYRPPYYGKDGVSNPDAFVNELAALI